MSDEALHDPEEIAKRAAQLAARAEELGRQAHDAALNDEQLRRLDAELAELEAEQARLDEGMGYEPDDEDREDDGATRHDTQGGPAWVMSLAHSMEELGDGIAGTVTRAIDAAFGAAGWNDEVEKRVAVSGALPVRVTSPGGGVEVRVGTGSEVVARIRRRGATPRSRPPIELAVRDVDGEIKVTVGGARRWFVREGAHLDIEVPAGSPVRVASGGGGIDVSGTRGAVSALTGGGGIRVDGADGAVQARTGGGGIHVSGRLRGDSSLVTGGGGIVVELDPATQIEVAAKGSAVRSEIPGLTSARGHFSGKMGSGADGHLRARTGGGSIVLRLANPATPSVEPSSGR